MSVEVCREVRITQDTRDELEKLAAWLSAKGMHVNAAMLSGLVKRWDEIDVRKLLP